MLCSPLLYGGFNYNYWYASFHLRLDLIWDDVALSLNGQWCENSSVFITKFGTIRMNLGLM